MAAEQKGAGVGTPKIKVDELPARVVPDPTDPVDAILVTGFLGNSSDAEHRRIYWDASMGSYIDVDTADVIHTEPLAKDQSPLGGSYIWLKRTSRGLSGGQGGNPMTGRFFEGPLMAAYGGQFGGAAPAAGAGFGGPGTIAYTYYVCHPTLVCTQFYCHSVQLPCVSGYCTRTVWECTAMCPVLTGNCPLLTANCPVASPGCPPAGPGGPVQGQGAAMADPAAAAQMMMPSLVCSNAPHCWYSWGACPTQYGCGPFHTPNCPQFQAQAPMAAAGPEAGAGAAMGMFPSLACSYAPGCWYSFGACPTQGHCGPFHTPNCPQFQAQQAQPAFGGGPHWSGYYCPGTAMCSFASCGHPCTR